jgi:hypothetical protein
MTVYTVWEIVDEYPEDGGGEYLVEIFQKKEAAEKLCKELNDEGYRRTKYEITEMEVK